MVSVLRTLQAEWNAIVPQAQALGIRRVRALNAPLETIEYRRDKLNWLREEIERLSGVRAIAENSTSLTPVQDLSIFTFGVELEVLMPPSLANNHSGLAEAIRRAGVDCNSEGYNHITGHAWKVVTDGSLGDYSRGAEVVSPALRGQAGLDAVTKVCNALKNVGCKVNKKCGLHVHVGAQNWTVQQFKNLVTLYSSGERFIDEFMAPSRRAAENMYCGPVRVNRQSLQMATTIDGVARAMGQQPGRQNVRGSGRYRKLNLQSFWQHGTIEVRHHQGTVEADKTVNWIKFCLRMAYVCQHGTVEPVQSRADLFSRVGLEDGEVRFFNGRADYFAAQLARTERRNAPRATVEQLDDSWRDAATLRLSEGLAREAGNAFEQTGSDLQRRARTAG